MGLVVVENKKPGLTNSYSKFVEFIQRKHLYHRQEAMKLMFGRVLSRAEAHISPPVVSRGGASSGDGHGVRGQESSPD